VPITREFVAQLAPQLKLELIAELTAALLYFPPRYGIDNPGQLQVFLAQLAHESADFTRLVENLNYRADRLPIVWPDRFPDAATAAVYAHQPQKLANYVYANRMGNGSAASDDGWQFRGRGLIQLTGRDNYQQFAASESLDLAVLADYLSTYFGGVHSACWYWQSNKLHDCCDRATMREATYCINRSYTSLPERLRRYDQIVQIWPV